MSAPATPNLRPITLDAGEARGLLDGRISLLLRPLEPQPVEVRPPDDGCGWRWHWSRRSAHYAWASTAEELCRAILDRCPFGVPGDRLWCREEFARRLDVDPVAEPEKARRYALYRADGTSLNEPHWHAYPARWTRADRMPRWASRIGLRLLGVRAARLSDIGLDEMIRTGIPWPDPPASGPRDDARLRAGLAARWAEHHRLATRESDPFLWALSVAREQPEAAHADH